MAGTEIIIIVLVTLVLVGVIICIAYLRIRSRRRNDRQKLDSVVPTHLDGVVIMTKNKSSYQMHLEARANSFKHRANSFKNHPNYQANLLNMKQKSRNSSNSILSNIIQEKMDNNAMMIPEEDIEANTIASLRSSQDSKSNFKESIV